MHVIHQYILYVNRCWNRYCKYLPMYIQIPTKIDQGITYKTYKSIIHANTHWYISIQTNSYPYKQYIPFLHICQYISICIHTDHYMQYMPIHTNTVTYNTCWYTVSYAYAHSKTEQYLLICTIHTIFTIHTNTYKCRPVHTMHTNTYQYK